MTGRQGDRATGRLAFLLLFLLLQLGCGAPGDPLPPLLNIPARTADLEAVQEGAELVVRWTVPGQTTEGFPIKDLERVAVLARDVDGQAIDGNTFESGSRELLSFSEVKLGERAERRFPLPGASGKRVAIAVKNYGLRSRAAGLSNIALLEVGPVLEAPKNVAATPRPAAIHVEWAAVPGASGYRVFRSEGDTAAFALRNTANAASFDDAEFQFGVAYRYRVRAYAQVSTGIDESPDSAVAPVTPKDVFPPSVPAGIEAVPTEASVELSWNLSPEPDTAGYNVYRQDAAGQPRRLNPEPVATPAYSDKNVQRGREYSYSVSALDDKGNESEKTAPIKVVIP